ncbi:MAG: hypothetical protein ACJ780_23410 [Solirubrobacteraceae bacterium]
MAAGCLFRGIARWPVAVVAALAVTFAAPASGAPVTAATPWVVQHIPSPRLVSAAVLSSVSCPSPRACVAVGYAVNAAGSPVPLAERWTPGRGWAIQPVPVPRGATSSFLFGVSCAAARSCTAVGSATRPNNGTVVLAERLDAKRWTIERVPRPAGRARREVDYLAAVSCPADTACTAVGFAGNATGTAGRTLTERWTRPRGWVIERTPARAAFLSGVSCSSPRFCAAVGWMITSRGGAAATLAERYTPAGWTTQRIPTPSAATEVQLTGVACASPSFCTAAGWFEAGGFQVMLTERWDGSRWVIGRTRYPAGAREVQLTDVSCPRPTGCTAVGSFTDTNGLNEPLAEHWTPDGWTIQAMPALGTPASPVEAGLAGVSCASLARCDAVGSATPLDGGGQSPISLRWGP